MSTNEPAKPQVPAADWLDRVRGALGPEANLALTSAERRLLLDLARIAAHTSDRITAPLSTYLAGIALAGLTPEARGERLAAVVRELEAGLG
jgi:hypothetical protein